MLLHHAANKSADQLARRYADNHTGVAPVDLSAVTEQWDGFTASLQQYDAHLEQQRGQLQAGILRQAEDFKGTVAGFASR